MTEPWLGTGPAAAERGPNTGGGRAPPCRSYFNITLGEMTALWGQRVNPLADLRRPFPQSTEAQAKVFFA
jgi:hypothetical protein